MPTNKATKGVTPAKAGVQNPMEGLDSRLRGNDVEGTGADWDKILNVNLFMSFTLVVSVSLNNLFVNAARKLLIFTNNQLLTTDY